MTYFPFYFQMACLKIKLIFSKTNHIQWFKNYHNLFIDKKGIEIGGPSPVFKESIMPIYSMSNVIDGVNFSNHTIWEGNINSTNYNYAENKVGFQYILDGTDLSEIEDNKYDFLIASHNLEHIANPIKAINEWKRVLVNNGVMLIIVPEKKFTFDRNRQYTEINHLKEDFAMNIKEDDLTHLEEVISLHDSSFDPGSPILKSDFEQRCNDNFKNRCMHQHVYDLKLLENLALYCNLEVLDTKYIEPIHNVLLVRKK